MGLKILCAGGSKEEKEAVETAVRAGIGKRPAQESWTVSLVKVGRQWSVTLDGPEKSARTTFMAAEGRLREAVSESLAGHGAAARSTAPAAAVRAGPAAAVPVASRSASPATGSAAARRNAYQCRKCGKGFVVSYELEGGEAEATVPAACPHCWQIEEVKVGLTAAVNNDYRVDKA